MDEIIKAVNKKLRRASVSAKVFLSKFAVLEEVKSQAFITDPSYLPFFYYLGREINPSSVVEFGVEGGLCSGLFFANCKEVKTYLGFQLDSGYYPVRIARRNIRQFFRKKFYIHHGNLSDDKFAKTFNCRLWDLVMINSEYPYKVVLQMLDMSWEHLSKGGLIILDYTKYNEEVSQAYKDFCHIKNRSENYFKTKYSVGIIRR